MNPRMGRPPKSGITRNKSLNIRLTENELKDLEYCSKKLGMPRTDIIVKGIQMIRRQINE